MTEAEAQARLGYMVASGVESTLSAPELADLLALAKVADAEDRAPSDDDWEPAFDLDRAAAEGWRWKAGKVAPRFGATVDGMDLQRQQIYANCLEQAEQYAKRIAGDVGVMRSPRVPTLDEFQVES